MQSDAWRRLRMYLSRYVDRVLARSCACEHPRRRWTPSWLAHDVFGRQKLVGSGPGRPSPPLDGGRVSGWLQILSSHRRSSGKSHTLAICRTDKQHDDKQTDSPPANTKPPITIPTPPRRGGDGARTAGQSAICACEPEITDPDMSDAQQRAVAIAKLGRPAGCWLAGWLAPRSQPRLVCRNGGAAPHYREQSTQSDCNFNRRRPPLSVADCALCWKHSPCPKAEGERSGIWPCSRRQEESRTREDSGRTGPLFSAALSLTLEGSIPNITRRRQLCCSVQFRSVLFCFPSTDQ